MTLPDKETLKSLMRALVVGRGLTYTFTVFFFGRKKNHKACWEIHIFFAVGHSQVADGGSSYQLNIKKMSDF